MTTTANTLFLSSEGKQNQDDKGGLFQVNLESELASCLVRNSPNCKVHGIAPYKKGIAFSDPKTNQIKQYNSSSGVSVLQAMVKKERYEEMPSLAVFCNQLAFVLSWIPTCFSVIPNLEKF